MPRDMHDQLERLRQLLDPCATAAEVDRLLSIPGPDVYDPTARWAEPRSGDEPASGVLRRGPRSPRGNPEAVGA